MKPFYKSKTIIGIAIAALPQLAQVAADNGIEVAAASDPNVQLVVTAAGVLLAIYGRAKAKQPISLITPKEPQ